MSRQTQTYRLTVSGIDGATVTRPGRTRWQVESLSFRPGRIPYRPTVSVCSPAGAVAAPSTPLSFTYSGTSDSNAH